MRVISRRPPTTTGAEHVAGDLRRHEVIARAVRGVDVVYHLAAETRKWLPDPRVFEDVNVGAALDVAQTAADAGVDRIVHVSSFTVFGPSPADGSPGDETTTCPIGRLQNDYQRSKRRAHDALHAAARQEGLPVAIACPGVLYGTADVSHANPVVECVARQLRGRLRAFPGGQRIWTLSWIPDVVQGLIALRARGTPGDVFVLGGEQRPLRDVFSWVQRHAGRRGPMKLPLWPFLVAGSGAQWLGRWTRRTPRLTRASLRFLGDHWSYNSDRAVHALGYRVTPIEESLPRIWQDLYEQSRVSLDPAAALPPA